MDVDEPNSPLLRSDAEGVVRLTLNRPQAYNSLSRELLGLLEQELARSPPTRPCASWSSPAPARRSAPGTISRRWARTCATRRSATLFEHCSRSDGRA